MQVFNFKGLGSGFTLLLLSSLRLAAQIDTGTISGYVLDPSEKAIPNAAIRIENTARAWVRSGQSNAAGYYEFDGLPPAEYRLSVTADSFAPTTADAVRVEVDQKVRLDLRLWIAGQRTQVVVNADIPAIQTGSGDLGAVLDQTLIVASLSTSAIFCSSPFSFPA